MALRGARINCKAALLRMIKSNQGFSVVESLVAILLLSIIFVGSLAFYYNANSLYYRGLHQQLASWIAESKLEEIRDAGCAAFSDPAVGVDVSVGSLLGTRTVLWYPSASSTAGSPVKACIFPNTHVAVQVSWTESGEGTARTVALESYVGP